MYCIPKLARNQVMLPHFEFDFHCHIFIEINFNKETNVLNLLN